MNYDQVIACGLLLLLIGWCALEFGWGGGNPHHKDHNSRGWGQ